MRGENEASDYPSDGKGFALVTLEEARCVERILRLAECYETRSATDLCAKVDYQRGVAHACFDIGDLAGMLTALSLASAAEYAFLTAEDGGELWEKPV